jgi:hypothetical protein
MLPFSYASHSPQAAAMHLCPFCYFTWDEDDLFPHWEKRVVCPRTRRVVPNLVVFLFGGGALCQFVGAHVTACWIDMLKLSTFPTTRGSLRGSRTPNRLVL